MPATPPTRTSGNNLLHPAASLLLLILLINAAWQVAAECPDINKGVLATHKTYRTRHKSKALRWDANLAAQAQAQAFNCVWDSKGASVSSAGVSVMTASATATVTTAARQERVVRNQAATWGVQFPSRGLDACSFATFLWYMQITSYDFNDPGTTWDSDVTTRQFSQVVWSNTTRVGCGYSQCNPLQNSGTSNTGVADYIVCLYAPGGNSRIRGTNNPYVANVKRSTCQTATKDDWCMGCSGSRCRQCFPRDLPPPLNKPAITLDPATNKCVSECSPPISGCKQCNANRECVDYLPD